MNIKPIGPLFGAEISGVDLADVSAGEFQAIRAALATHEVLVFRNQDISTEAHIEFGKRFGELTVSPFSPNDDERPELIVLDNHPGNASPLTDVWHSDETFREAPPLATLLRATIVPAFGGDTMFASMTAAYDGLSDRMKTYLSGLTALHGFGRFGEMLRQDDARRHLLHRVENQLPMPHHPVIRVHPETQRQAIFVNAHFTLKVDGVPEDESRSILDFLFRRALIAEYQLRVSWAPNTMVIWDNRSVQHYAPNDYQPQRRRMERVTVRGTKPVGDTPTMHFAERARGILARNVGETEKEPAVLNAPRRQFDRTEA